MIWFLLVVGVILVAPYLREALRKPVSARRKDTPKNLASLTHGKVSYRWHGPASGPVVVCIHGLTSPGFVWDGLMPYLTKAGFRVLSFDLYGRGYSDRPNQLQDATLFSGLVHDLLADQNVDEPVTLIGNSMGSAVATAFSAQHPSRVRQAVLLVPAGLGHNLGAAAALTRKVPLVGHWLIHAFYPRALRKGIDAERALPSSVPDIQEKQLDELNYRGFLRSVHSSLCGILGAALEHEHRSLQKHNLPVVAVWGADDDVIPLPCMDRMAQWNPDASHIVLENCGHGLVYTHTKDLWQKLEPVLLR
ncbi:alpha/beta fold hydrolase [Shimia thalassica]|uniref:alpha/beta fold hydrolase n=1 Tax=Shimia thalassica TaxID=1715693 RepID=UPI0024956EE9|nr:alpha/beta hydrolase [Shimia thalassica]